MCSFWRRLVCAVLALACLAGAAGAQTRPLGVEDIVSTEAFGRASISPDARWGLYEKRGPYDTAPRFDLGPRSQWAITDLWLLDLRAPNATPRRLLSGEGPGLIRGDWSPSGGRLLVYRLRADRLEIGVVTMAGGTVRWTGLAAEMPTLGAAAQWLSDDQLVVMTRQDGSLPLLIRYYGGSQAAAIAAWRRTAEGREPSRTVVDADQGITADQPATDQALILIDARSGDQQVVARGRLRDFAASPDGRALALVRAGPLIPVRPDAVVQSDVPKRGRLSVIALGTGQEFAVDPGMDVAPHLLRWKADSAALLAWVRRDGEAWSDGGLVRVSRDASVSRVERGDLKARPAAMDIDSLRGVQADWLGDTPVLYARAPDGDRFDWYALDGTVPRALTSGLATAPPRLAAVGVDAAYVFGDGAFWRMGPRGLRAIGPGQQALAQVSVGDIEKPIRLRVNESPRQAWAAAVGAGGVLEILDGSGPTLLMPGGQDGDPVLAVSRTSALTVSSQGLVETLSLRTAKGVRPVDRVNAGLADVALSKPIRLTHLDAFGRPAVSWLFLPEGRSVGAARGMVVDVYPGSVDGGEWGGPLALTYGLRAAVLAGAGFAVLSPAIPIDRKDTTSADYYVRSVDLAVDAALAARPELPGDRIAVAGHSFGGYVALAMATRPTRYRSYISWAGTTEMVSKWGEFIPATRFLAEDRHMMRNQQGWMEVGQGGLNGPPWSDPAAYIAASPVLSADRITAPVLLISADKDFVPLSQAELMFSARYRLGGKVRLVTYWGEEHSLWSPANIRDLYAQIFDWLDETLRKPLDVRPDEPGGAPTPAPTPRTPPRP